MKKKIIIFTIALFSMLLMFNYVVMPLYVRHSSLVVVPDVSGKDMNEARKIIEDSGLDVKQGEIRYDASKPIGLVLDQNPPANETVKKGRRIYLVICGGEQLFEVPKLTGRTIRDAKFSLAQRNLLPGEIVKKFSNQYQEDVVISQVIQPGSKVKKSTKVDLIVSNGPQLGSIIIPDITGKTLDEAKKILAERKLRLGRITYQPSSKTPGIIVDQYPRKEKSAVENTPVDIFVTQKRKEVEEDVFEEEVEIDKPKEKGQEPKEDNTPKEKIKQEPKEKIKQEPKEKIKTELKEKSNEKPKEKK